MILRIEQQDKSYIKLSPYKWISYQYKVIADHVMNTVYTTMLIDNYSKCMHDSIVSNHQIIRWEINVQQVPTCTIYRVSQK